MSYDVYLTMDTGGPRDVEVTWRNYTRNTSNMWRTAGLDIADCDGVSAVSFAEGLAVAIDAMKADPDHFRAMEPANGWGSYTGTLEFLEQLLTDCTNNPRCTVRVSW